MDWSCRHKIRRMKNRTRKKHLTKARKLPTQFVKDTLRAMAEAKAGKLKPYKFNSEDRAWLDMAPVGREFGSPECDL